MALFPPNPDVIGDQQDDLLQLLIELGFEDLTEREAEFVDSMQERVEKYEERTILSVAQEEWLSNLADKYGLKPL